MLSRKNIRVLPLLALALTLLNGCIDVAILGGTYAVRSSDRDELQTKAEAGDVEAQYQLGKQWCCFGPGFDTQIATVWLCRAAKSGHMEARYQLGRIYNGEVFRIPAAGPKMMGLVFGAESLVDSYLWHSLAAAEGHEDAMKSLADLDEDLQPGDREMIENMKNNLATTRCEHREVFPD